MATTYRKNAQNVYKPPLYAQFWIWWVLVLALAVLSLVVGLVVSIKIVQVVLWSLVADAVSDQSEDNRKIYHAEKGRKGGY